MWADIHTQFKAPIWAYIIYEIDRTITAHLNYITITHQFKLTKIESFRCESSHLQHGQEVLYGLLDHVN